MASKIPATERVAKAAEALGLEIEIREMESSTKTAEDAARACGCSVGQIVKSLVFKKKHEEVAVVLLVSGSSQADMAKAAAAAGDELERPNGRWVREATGFAIGGIPPVGHAGSTRIFMDEDLLTHDTVWAAAGTPNAVFSVDPEALGKAVGAVSADLKAG